MVLNYDHIHAALTAVESEHTRRSYLHSLTCLEKWLQGRALDYATLLDYRAALVQLKKSPQTINQNLGGIRFYLREMAKRGHLPAEAAEAICAVDNLKVKGRKLGNWLQGKEAESFLAAPDLSTPIGLRDRAILGLMIGAGLRRSEVCGLEVKHFEKRDGRWVLVGITGKHGRTRNIPIADWIKALCDAWTDRAEIKSGPIVRRAFWSEAKQKLTVEAEALSTTALFHIVKRLGKGLNLTNVAPHDLRRTFARLAFEGSGGELKQIQLALGHANQSTTEAYVNAQINLQMSASDMLNINVEV